MATHPWPTFEGSKIFQLGRGKIYWTKDWTWNAFGWIWQLKDFQQKSKTSFLLDEKRICQNMWKIKICAIYFHIFCWNYMKWRILNLKVSTLRWWMFDPPSLQILGLTAWIWPTCWTLHQLIGSWSYYCLLWSFIHRSVSTWFNCAACPRGLRGLQKPLFIVWRSTKKLVPGGVSSVPRDACHNVLK